MGLEATFFAASAVEGADESNSFCPASIKEGCIPTYNSLVDRLNLC